MYEPLMTGVGTMIRNGDMRLLTDHAEKIEPCPCEVGEKWLAVSLMLALYLLSRLYLPACGDRVPGLLAGLQLVI